MKMLLLHSVSVGDVVVAITDFNGKIGQFY